MFPMLMFIFEFVFYASKESLCSMSYLLMRREIHYFCKRADEFLRTTGRWPSLDLRFTHDVRPLDAESLISEYDAEKVFEQLFQRHHGKG